MGLTVALCMTGYAVVWFTPDIVPNAAAPGAASRPLVYRVQGVKGYM